jgi:rRNA maturation protein Rpf1
MENLTSQERARFVLYLKEDATQRMMLVEQMTKMAMPPPIIQKFREEAMAANVVANMLNATASDTL